jgi:hypothetical protein
VPPQPPDELPVAALTLHPRLVTAVDSCVRNVHIMPMIVATIRPATTSISDEVCPRSDRERTRAAIVPDGRCGQRE